MSLTHRRPFVGPRLARRILDTAAAWPVESQQRSRRNALAASTDLSERRRELLEVEDYLAVLASTGRQVG